MCERPLGYQYDRAPTLPASDMTPDKVWFARVPGNGPLRVRAHPDPKNQCRTQYHNDSYIVIDQEQHFTGIGVRLVVINMILLMPSAMPRVGCRETHELFIPPQRSETVCSPLFIDDVEM